MRGERVKAGKKKKDKMRIRKETVAALTGSAADRDEFEAAPLHLHSSRSPQTLPSVFNTLLSSNSATPRCDRSETRVAAP